MKELGELEKLNAVAQRGGEATISSLARLFCCVVPAFDLLYRPDAWIRGGTLVLLCGLCAFELISLMKILRTHLLSKSASCASARDRIGSWKLRLEAGAVPPDIIEFDAGDFWDDGRSTIRVFQDDNWIVLAYFRHRVISSKPLISVFDATATPLLYFPEQHRIRVGKRKFRKVEVRSESQPSFQKLAQVVATA